MQSRLCLAQSEGAGVEQAGVFWESKGTVSVILERGGRWNGIAFWFEVGSDAVTATHSAHWYEWILMSSCRAGGCTPLMTWQAFPL